MKNIFYLILVFFLIQLSLNAKDLRISVDQLSKNIADYKIVDVRNYEDFSISHIKNSLNFPVSKSYENKKIDGKIVKPNKMQAIVRDLGLNIDDNIVIYDDGIFYDASRIFWTFEVYGFKNVKLLNGGFDIWEKKELPISSEIIKSKPSTYIALINNKRLSTKFTTQIATRNPNQIVIDARDYQSYIGKASVAKRFGHIPNAIHIPANYNLEKENELSKLKDVTSLDKNHIEKLHSAHINLAGSSLNNPDFQAKVKKAIEHFDFPWDKLELEITESSAIGNFNMANEFITWLKEQNIGLALDDFGTGMASFEYLKSLPFDVVKIDGSFVKDMHTDPIDKAVIKYIQEIAQLKGQETVAEYVETKEDVEELRALGITYGQGYFLGKPRALSSWLN